MSEGLDNLSAGQTEKLVQTALEQIEEKKISVTREQATQIVRLFQSRFVRPRYPRAEPKDVDSLVAALGRFIDNSTRSWIRYVDESRAASSRGIA